MALTHHARNLQRLGVHIHDVAGGVQNPDGPRGRHLVQLGPRDRLVAQKQRIKLKPCQRRVGIL